MITMILSLIIRLVDVYTMLIFVYVILSWIPQKKGFVADVDRALGMLCDPYLNLFKKIIPPIGGMIDISPILAIIVLQLVVRVLVFIF